LELLHRRLLIITLAAWLPLLLLATLGSSAGDVRLSFLHDIEVHVRFLIALPVLVAAELIVHSRIRPVVSRFVERRIVLPQDLPRFDSAIESATRLRNSIPVEIGLLVCVYTVGLWVWHGRVALDVSTWYAMPGGRWHLTRWLLVRVRQPPHSTVHPSALVHEVLRLVSLSLARLEDQPTPRSDSPRSLRRSRLLGQECLCLRPDPFRSGCHARRSGCQSRPLPRGKLAILQVTDRRLCSLFRSGYSRSTLDVYSPNGSRKTGGIGPLRTVRSALRRQFEQKWVMRDSVPSEELLGAADIQSLADLCNSYALVREMRSVPFGLEDISRLAAATAAPSCLSCSRFSPRKNSSCASSGSCFDDVTVARLRQRWLASSHD
jgi:hypothetical protein